MIRFANKKWNINEVLSLFDETVRDWFISNFSELTEPQAYAIPLIHERKNVLVCSPTGTGKTLTAFLSILNRLILLAKKGELEDKIYCVYVSPLRALANDIGKNLIKPLNEMKKILEERGREIPDIRVHIRTGDTSQHERQKMLRKPPHIYITTPESLSLSITAPKMREKFRDVKYIIVDEIHEIASSKRGVMLSLDLERLHNIATEKPARIGLSATQAPIEEIAKYLAGYENDNLREIYVVNVFHPKEYEVRVMTPVKNLFSVPYEIASEKMYDLIFQLVMQHKTTLIFTNTRSGAESVAYKLKERGLSSIEVHHGSLSKELRFNVEEKLKNGELKCVVSSTSLELGIDIGYIDLVIQIGSPKSVAKGIQRIGRSGHQVHARPKGIFVVIDPDELIECTVITKCIYEKKIDRIRIPKNCLDVLAQILVGMSLERKWKIEEAYELIRRSYCYHDLPKEKFLSVLNYLGGKVGNEEIYSKIRLYEEEGTFGSKKGARIIYFQNVGTIPDEADYTVISTDKRPIGELSEKFVEYLKRGDIFVLGSRTYEFLHTRDNKVYVKDATGRKPTVPSWVGELLPRSFDLSIKVGEFRELLKKIIGEFGEEYAKEYLMREYYLDENCAESIIQYVSSQMKFGIPSHKNLIIEGYIDNYNNYNIIFHFPFGRRVNDALSRAWASAISNLVRANARISVTDDAFMLTVPKYVSLKEVVGLVKKSNFIELLRNSIRNSEMFKHRFRHVATRAFMVLRKYKSHEITVARQQLKSERLLSLLHTIDNFPIIEETYNEILNIHMDVENAINILEDIERGRINISTIEYSSTPSPFSYGVILAGISDIVLMEDKSALLRELHSKLIEKITPIELIQRSIELEHERIKEYFESKIPRVNSKEDIVKFLDEIGFGEVLKEKGISIYRYSSVSQETLRKWVEELIKEDKIVSIFIRKPLWTSKNNEKIFYSLYARAPDKNLEKYLKYFKKEITFRQLCRKLKLDPRIVKEIVRNLEASYLIKRGTKGFIIREVRSKIDKEEAARILIEKNLEYFAPKSVSELSYILRIPEQLVWQIIEKMKDEDIVKELQPEINDEKRYILKRDFLKLIEQSEYKKKYIAPY